MGHSPLAARSSATSLHLRPTVSCTPATSRGSAWSSTRGGRRPPYEPAYLPVNRLRRHRPRLVSDEFCGRGRSNAAKTLPNGPDTSMRLTLHTFLTLDGVLQAPGGPGEDDTGGFTHGGWTSLRRRGLRGRWPAGSSTPTRSCSAARPTRSSPRMAAGRRRDDPIANKLNVLPKYVALDGRSTRSTGRTRRCRAVTSPSGSPSSRQSPGDELQVHGSGDLAQTLIAARPRRRVPAVLFPVHLGSGKKLFPDGLKAAALRLASSSTTSTGVIIATYEPAGPVQYGSY